MNLHRSRTELLFLLKSSNSVRDWCKFNQKKGLKWYPGGTWEPLGSGSEKRPPFRTVIPSILGPFLEPWAAFWDTYVS